MRESEVIGELRAYVEKTQEQLGNCPTALVASRGGEVVVEAYDSGVYASHYDVDEASLWPLFSATKTYIAALLLNLCHEDVLQWDDPVVKHLPEFGSQGSRKIDPEKATIRHLASHTSGIDLVPPKSHSELADLASGWIETEPGEVFNYSWQGMHVLQRLIEAATGEIFPDVLYDRILDPLGLNQTRYIYKYDSDQPVLPKELPDPDAPEKAFVLSHRMLHPHYGLFTTAPEFNRFGQFWLGEGTHEGRTYFTPELQAEILKHHATRPSDNGKYGLLVWLFDEAEGFVISGAGSKITGIAPNGGVVTVMRLPQEEARKPGYDFYADKVSVLRFAGKLGR